MILFSCEHATARMTDHLEGALPWHKRLAMWGHLLLCRACRAFLGSLRAVPLLAREAFREPEPESAVGCASLEAALTRIRAGEGKGPRFHPEAASFEQLRTGGLDLAMRLLLETHLGACAACRQAHPDLGAHGLVPAQDGEPPLAAGLRAQLPDPGTWTWHRRLLGGARLARLWEDKDGGVGLWLVFVPGGHRFPAHAHTGQEAAVLLSGWVQDGPDLNGPGDFVRHEGGSCHAPEATGEGGCWILARVGPGGLHFKGWRRIFA